MNTVIIEKQKLIFNKSIDVSRLKISELQKQYLTYLVGQDTIEELTVRLYKNGWLVNFQELFSLIQLLTMNNAIMNPDFIRYFQTAARAALSSKSKTATGAAQASNGSLSTQAIEALLALPFFRTLPRELAHILLQKARVTYFSVDSSIAQQGEIDRHLFCLTKGQVAIYRNVQGRRNFVALANEPAIFGEASFLTGAPRSADLVATQACEILSVPYEAKLLDPLINTQKASQLLQRFWVLNALSNSEFFKNIPPDCLDALTFAGRIVTLADAQTLFTQNAQSDAAYLVIQGQIKIFQNQKAIATLPQGSFFGEVSLVMTNGARTGTAVSHGTTLLMEVTRTTFYNLLSQNLFLAKDLQLLASKRIGNDAARNPT